MKKLASIAIIFAMMTTVANATVAIIDPLPNIVNDLAAAGGPGTWDPLELGTWNTAVDPQDATVTIGGQDYKIFAFEIQTDNANGDWTNASIECTLTAGAFYQYGSENWATLATDNPAFAAYDNQLADTFATSPGGAVAKAADDADFIDNGGLFVTVIDTATFSAGWFDVTEDDSKTAPVAIARLAIRTDSTGTLAYEVFQDNGGGSVPDGIAGVISIADLLGTVVGPTPGDLFPIPGDGYVDGDDIGVLLANWGSVDPGNPADLYPIPGDGIVDGDDLGVLLSNWTGTPPPLTAGGAAVPEPASFTLLLLGALAMLGIYRKR